MSEKIRTFIAVRFSTELTAALDRLLCRLGDSLDRSAPIKWVDPKNIHLTLQFLGDVDAGLVPKLAGSLGGAYDDQQPFETALSGVGCFPGPTRARVVWVGVRQGVDRLKGIQAATLRVTEGFGFVPEDRPFKAHVTVGRVRAKGRQPHDLSAALAAFAEVDVGRCQISEVHLVKSELKPSGPVYTTLDSFSLGG